MAKIYRIFPETILCSRFVLRTYKHIIWDWNGTLLDDLTMAIDAINVILAKYDLSTIDQQRYLEIFGFPVKDYYVRLGFDFKKTPFKIVGTEFIDEYTRRMFDVPLHEGAVDFLERLRRNGITQSLLSAAKVQMLETLTEHHAMQKYFVRILGLDNHYAHSKLEIGLDWMQAMPYKAEEVLFIGDTFHDGDVARDMGVDIAFLSHGHTTHDKLATTGNPVFRNFTELGEWFFDK